MAREVTSRTTTDHDEIRAWVEERGGTPAHVKRTGKEGDVGILRIDFPGYTGKDTLEAISWDEFFEKFDEQKLAFIYQDVTASGEPSFFNKLVSRKSAGDRSSAGSGGPGGQKPQKQQHQQRR